MLFWIDLKYGFTKPITHEQDVTQGQFWAEYRMFDSEYFFS